jgi:asparagine synthase (glutamine-hydrolysing)
MGFFLMRDGSRGQQEALRAARDQFTRHGFSTLVERHVPGWTILHAPYILGGPELVAESGDSFAIAAGTLAYGGRMGPAALEGLLADSRLPHFDKAKLAGQFGAVLHQSGRTFIVGDYFACFPVYHDRDLNLFSTSLLAAAAALPRVTLDRQGLYEYAFQSCVLGDDTALSEVKRLGPTQIVELIAKGVQIHRVSKPLPSKPSEASLADQLSFHRRLLHEVVEEQVRHFGDKIQCPLSGGLDSRLVLAVLRSLGCRPSVYVYGPGKTSDVTIAKQIGEAEGFDVEWIEKDRYRDIAPDEFPEQVARNFHENDGTPNFGGIFDNGGNSYARNSRHGSGSLAVSGGCGEVYRNFFFLPDRQLTASAVTRSFFCRFDRGDTTSMFDPRSYTMRIDDKILEAMEWPDNHRPLQRPLIEQIYPRVRARSLFGREISIEARYSPYLLPFLDHRVVAEAMTVPLPLKHAGLFEAQLLNTIDPSLARRPSAYGHDFATPPSLRHRFEEWTTRMRPTWLRKRSYAIQRRLRPMSDEHGGLFSPEYMGRVIDLEFPIMRRYFQLEKISDSGLWRRIACLEYFAAFLGSRLSAA